MPNLQDPKSEEFAKVYDELADAIFRHCYFRVFNREQARDLMQEAFVRTWEYYRAGGEVRNVKNFLYRVANNLIIDYARKKKALSLDELHEQGFDPEIDERERVMASLDALTVLKVLQKLAPKYRDFVTMRYLDELSPGEIAAITGLSENAVSVRIHRGLTRLREANL